MATETKVKERPILFSAPMVRALLEGRKTQTRRLVKPKPDGGPTRLNLCQKMSGQWIIGKHVYTCPYGVPFDWLWVRERFGAFRNSSEECNIEDATYVVLSDGTQVYRSGKVVTGLAKYSEGAFWFKWRPSIHMPRWASRLTLEITDVRVERLQAISEEDAIAEGVEFQDDHKDAWRGYKSADGSCLYNTAVRAYQDLWESINGPGSWDANPWVWAVTFKRIEGSNGNH